MLSLKSTLNLLLVCTLFTACSTRETGYTKTQHSSQNNNYLSSFKKAYAHYKGTPYCYGGTTHRCIDCSAFVQKMYQEACHIKIPRTTHQQIKIGLHVKKKNLSTGDIVFFKTASKTLHSGIYLKDGEFIHASSSHGVIKSNLHNPYWNHAYLQARRILP